MLVPGIIHHGHLGSDIVIRHTCALPLSLRHPYSTCACVPFQLYCMCTCSFTHSHTHTHIYLLVCISHRSSFMCKSTFFNPHSLVTALPWPPPLLPPSLHLSVWEKPVGFVLSWVWRHADLCCNRPWRWGSSILSLPNHSLNLAACINSNPRKENEKILWHQRMDCWDLKLELWGCRGYF